MRTKLYGANAGDYCYVDHISYNGTTVQFYLEPRAGTPRAVAIGDGQLAVQRFRLHVVDIRTADSAGTDHRLRAYVTQPNGKVESSRRVFLVRTSPNPKPGSTVFVPEKDPADKKDYVAATAAVAQILASLVAIIVVVRR